MSINVKRFINRETGHFSVEVLTPMFLGGADGNGELRSPPFKNAIRYWWRLTQGDTPKDQLLAKEQALFGGVNEDKKSNPEMKPCRSLVDVVVTGDVTVEQKGSTINIGTKKNPEAKGNNVSLSAYLGLGPVAMKGNQYVKTPISPGQIFSLHITWPKEYSGEILDTISLFAHFGALGARSRNGWGSFSLSSSSGVQLKNFKALHKKYGQDIGNIFKNNSVKKFPSKLGLSKFNGIDSSLLWEISSGNTLKDVMQEAASKYMDVRQSLPFGRPNGNVAQRHILGYPVMHHDVKSWEGKNKNDGRMPSQLRILVRKNGDIYRSYFFHLPHPIPKEWDSTLGSELSVWQEIHRWLDKNCTRVPI